MTYRLTQYAHGGGSACKIPPGELESVVAGLVGTTKGSTPNERGAGRQVGPRVPEVDGHASAPLLGPAVGFHPGEGADQRRLAVVDVTRRGDDVHTATLPPARQDCGMTYRLTQYAHGGGCACKIPPGELETVVAGRVV